MLSNRDTPLDLDGWACVIQDLKRLELLITGGANDLNAGAKDANQEALNELSTALGDHEVDPAAHAALLADYLLRADYTAPTAAAYSGFSVNANLGALAPTTVSSIFIMTSGEVDPGSAYNAATGVYTVPATGYYLVTFSVSYSWGAGADDSQVRFQANLFLNGSAVNDEAWQTTGVRFNFFSAFGNVSKTVTLALTAGDLLTLRGLYALNFGLIGTAVAASGSWGATYVGPP